MTSGEPNLLPALTVEHKITNEDGKEFRVPGLIVSVCSHCLLPTVRTANYADKTCGREPCTKDA